MLSCTSYKLDDCAMYIMHIVMLHREERAHVRRCVQPLPTTTQDLVEATI